MSINPLEAQWIQAAASGDREAFSHLAHAVRASLTAYLIRSVGDVHLAEDLLQDVLFKAWRALDQLQRVERFTPWIFRIANRCVIDHQRRRSLPEVAAEDGFLLQAEIATPENVMLADEMVQVLNRVLQGMPEAQRDVFLLRQHGSLTFKEIAAMRDEPLSTVLGHMSYAVAKLKTALRRA